MAFKKLKEKAISLRKRGMSYSQIKERVKVSKSTLSLWLRDMPLSNSDMKRLRDFSEKRIESYRKTMSAKKNKRLDDVYKKVSLEIGGLSDREIFIAGLFLYWGEGSKNQKATVSLSNTDPHMIRFYIKWLSLFGFKKKDLAVTLHLYSDMDSSKEINFWSKELNISKHLFKKPYIKKTNFSGITYRNGFGHGTCMIRVFSRDASEKVEMGLKYLRFNYS